MYVDIAHMNPVGWKKSPWKTTIWENMSLFIYLFSSKHLKQIQVDGSKKLEQPIETGRICV